MKKRKFPILPVTLLVILLGGAVVMVLKPFDPVPQQPDNNELIGDSRQETSADELAKIASKQSGKRAPMAPEIEDENAEPALLLPATYDYKPTPNPTSTSAQWYKGDPKPTN